jgi:6-pyruvoyltetrahydropterin/6-carboxytetrahydropterin synthase
MGENLIISTGLQKSSSLRPPSWLNATTEFFRPEVPMPTVTVTRRLKFNAAHRVHNPALSDEENSRIFGKCNNLYGHGHNYTLDVSVAGEVDPDTGYVFDLSSLKELVTREVVEVVDHHNLNVDVPFMRDIIPTAENMIVQFWRILENRIDRGRLVRLVLWETENNCVEYDGR